MLDHLKETAQQQAAGRMFDQFRDQLSALALVVARRERRQLELARRLADASDADVEVEDIVDVEARAEKLEAMAEHAADADLEAWYFGEFAPEHLDSPEQAAQYAGLDDNEWQEQKESWAATYRDQRESAAEKSVDELVDIHTEATFGVSREEFEENVVEWRPGEAIQHVLTHNLTTVESIMDAVATDLEDDAR